MGNGSLVANAWFGLLETTKLRRIRNLKYVRSGHEPWFSFCIFTYSYLELLANMVKKKQILVQQLSNFKSKKRTNLQTML